MTQNGIGGLVLEQILWHDLTNCKDLGVGKSGVSIWQVYLKKQQDSSSIQLHETLKIYNCGLAS